MGRGWRNGDAWSAEIAGQLKPLGHLSWGRHFGNFQGVPRFAPRKRPIHERRGAIDEKGAKKRVEKGLGVMEDAGLNLVRGGDGWAVEEREGRGRCLVATRQLEVRSTHKV